MIGEEPAIDGKAVERILDATFKCDVPNVDRDKLAARLNKIASHHHLRVIQRTAPAARRARVKKAVRTARRLIRENEWILDGTEVFAPEPQPHSAALQRMINAWIAASDLQPPEVARLLGGGWEITAGVKVVPPSDGLPYSFGKGVSAFEETIHRLRVAFEMFFNQPATCTKVVGRYKGAFIDFAEVALREMGITNGGKPFSRSSIATALRTLDSERRNRPRKPRFAG